MGTGLVYHVGQVQYVDSSSVSSGLNTSLLTYVAGGVGGAILVIVFIVIIVFIRKSRQSARAVKRMRNQMDVLEARVAKECKEGWSGNVLLFWFISGPGNGPPSATKVVLVVVLLLGVVVSGFSIPQGFVVSQPIVMKLLTYINGKILHQATVADF